MAKDKRAIGPHKRIGNAAGTSHRNSRPIKRQRKPMIFRAECLDQIDTVAPAKLPKMKRGDRIKTPRHCERHDSCADFLSLAENVTAWVTSEPRLMPMGVQPVHLETGAVFLTAPAAATFQEKEVHFAACGWAASPRFSTI